MKESKLRAIFLAAAAAVLAVPAISHSGDKSDLEGVSVKVSYADLNLEKQEGARALYRRLQKASRQACDYENLRMAGSLKRMMDTRQCYEDSLSIAVEELDNPLVTEIHNG